MLVGFYRAVVELHGKHSRERARVREIMLAGFIAQFKQL